MFSGSYEHTIDTKGRLSIPSKFRETLIQKYNSKNITLIVQGGCLLAYPQSVWERLLEQFELLNPFDSQVLNAQRRFFSKAHDGIEVDGQGRVLVPPALRNQVGLNKEVVLVGSTNKFEIWDKASWSEYLESKQENQDQDWSLAAQVLVPAKA
jgi:MraZ protein